MSNLMLDDKNAMDDINPFTDPENFFPPGTSKHTLDFKKYKAPVQEEQEEYVSPACDMLSKGVGRLGYRSDECTLSRPLLPGRNIDRGFTVKEKIEIENQWKSLVYARYSKSLKIDLESLKKQIENTNKKNFLLEYNLSEIIFT